MKKVGSLVGALAAAATLLLSGAAHAQDAAAVNPKTIHVTLENDRIRVFEAVLPPGAQEQMHSHPASVFYVIQGGRVRSHGADGKVTETELHAGDTVYREPLTHWAENIGTTTIRLVLVELKSPR